MAKKNRPSVPGSAPSTSASSGGGGANKKNRPNNPPNRNTPKPKNPKNPQNPAPLPVVPAAPVAPPPAPPLPPGTLTQDQIDARSNWWEDNPFEGYTSLVNNGGVNFSNPSMDSFYGWLGGEGWAGLQSEYGAAKANDFPGKLNYYDWIHRLNTPAPSAAPSAPNTGNPFSPTMSAAKPVGGNTGSINPFGGSKPIGGTPALPTMGGSAAKPLGGNTGSVNPFGGSKPLGGTPALPTVPGQPDNGTGVIDLMRKRYNSLVPQQRGINSAFSNRPSRWAVY